MPRASWNAHGRKIAIAGAGPTGLTAAFYLAMLGHDVTVFDEQGEAGGMLRFALPDYRLPKAVLRREIELIERVGVKFVFNTRVGIRHLAERIGRPLRRGVPLHRNLERVLGLSAGHGVEGRVPGAAFPGVGGAKRRGSVWAARWP